MLKALMLRFQGKGWNKMMVWEPNTDTVFHLVNRRTGEISKVRYSGAPMFALHQINAFEDNGVLVMDMCCGDDGEVIADFTLENLRRPQGEEMDKFYNALCRNLPRRYALPLNVDSATPLNENLIKLPYLKAKAVMTKPGEVFLTHEELYGEELCQLGGCEFPHINYDKHSGRPYRYYYACGFGHVFSDSLLKMDTHTKEMKSWKYPGLYPSEPVFVPAPDATEEDDGVVMSVIITPRQDKSSFLLVLDAKSFKELGRAEVPVNIPYGT